MSSVPPTGRGPQGASSSSGSDGPSKGKKSGSKEFKLPERKQPPGEKEGKPKGPLGEKPQPGKKGVGASPHHAQLHQNPTNKKTSTHKREEGKREVAQKHKESDKSQHSERKEAVGEGKGQGTETTQTETAAQEVENVSQTHALEAKAQISQVTALIQKMVEGVQVGVVGGKDLINMQLSSQGGGNVPEAFLGSHLSLSFQENGMVITFSQFETPQQEQQAIQMVEQHKEELTKMMKVLQDRNLQVAELNIGSHTVNLPRVEKLPSPFEIRAPEPKEGERQETPPDKDDDEGSPQ